MTYEILQSGEYEFGMDVSGYWGGWIDGGETNVCWGYGTLVDEDYVRIKHGES